ncbi:MAG: hypothetical protein M1377_06305 [Deltaproteobacteria bacterium]|nr:hypothetical protein [Deltaproteobacteria bacterium]
MTGKIKMRFTCKKRLDTKRRVAILIKRIYKTTPTFSVEHPDFRRLFPTRQIVPSRGAASLKTRERGAITAKRPISGSAEGWQTVPHKALEGSKYQKEGKHG